MSNTVHYTPTVHVSVQEMLRAVPCGAGRRDWELDLSDDPAKVDCQQCLAALSTPSQRTTEP